MFEVSLTHFLGITCFFAGSSLSLIIYIYKIQICRIRKIERLQKECPVNKIYTILEIVRTDTSWIKKKLDKINK